MRETGDRPLPPWEVTSTERIGRAKLSVARNGAPKRILETPDINTATGVGARVALGQCRSAAG
jgi:hypothetical protein